MPAYTLENHLTRIQSLIDELKWEKWVSVAGIRTILQDAFDAWTDTPTEQHKLYKRLSQMFHPDKNKNSQAFAHECMTTLSEINQKREHKEDVARQPFMKRLIVWMPYYVFRLSQTLERYPRPVLLFFIILLAGPLIVSILIGLIVTLIVVFLPYARRPFIRFINPLSNHGIDRKMDKFIQTEEGEALYNSIKNTGKPTLTETQKKDNAWEEIIINRDAGFFSLVFIAQAMWKSISAPLPEGNRLVAVSLRGLLALTAIMTLPLYFLYLIAENLITKVIFIPITAAAFCLIMRMEQLDDESALAANKEMETTRVVRTFDVTPPASPLGGLTNKNLGRSIADAVPPPANHSFNQPVDSGLRRRHSDQTIKSTLPMAALD